MTSSTSAIPPVFISHGSPMTALEPREAGAFWPVLARRIEARFGRPKAVLAVSAHTLAREPALLAAPRHHAVHDFGGFDERLFAMRHDAPGAPDLAERVRDLLAAAGEPVHLLPEAAGLDHGIWVPLRAMWPAADMPVLPLAFPPGWSPARLHALGRALEPIAAEGVWVIGTGSITHNLRAVFAGGLHDDGTRLPTPESTAFRDWFAARAAAGDWPALFDWQRRAPHAARMHPTDEHLLPFFVGGGAAGEAAEGLRVHASVTFGELGMDAFAFGEGASDLAAD